MTRSFVRIAAYASIAAAVLALAALIGFFVVVGSDKIADAAQSASFYGPATAALLSIGLLGLGLVGLFLHQAARLGTLGVVGFALALFGTIVAAGGLWTYVFVVPHFAARTPDLINEGSGSVLAGFVLSFAAMAVGWVVFALATIRARVFPRWAAYLLLAGAAITLFPLPSRTLVLALAVAILSARTLRTPGADAATT